MTWVGLLWELRNCSIRYLSSTCLWVRIAVHLTWKIRIAVTRVRLQMVEYRVTWANVCSVQKKETQLKTNHANILRLTSAGNGSWWRNLVVLKRQAHTGDIAAENRGRIVQCTEQFSPIDWSGDRTIIILSQLLWLANSTWGDWVGQRII